LYHEGSRRTGERPERDAKTQGCVKPIPLVIDAQEPPESLMFHAALKNAVC
jgi:hypothetical protein